MTKPHTSDDARWLMQAARNRRCCVEVLFADSPASDDRWRLTTFGGPSMSIEVAAPPKVWRDTWLTPTSEADSAPAPNAAAPAVVPTPADWFIDATEKLGDALLAAVKVREPKQRVAELEACLLALPDHEILHQRLADAAKQARLG